MVDAEERARGAISAGTSAEYIFVATRVVGAVPPKTIPSSAPNAVWVYPVTIQGVNWDATVYFGDANPDKADYIFDIYLVQAPPDVAAELRSKLGQAQLFESVRTRVRWLDLHRVVRR